MIEIAYSATGETAYGVAQQQWDGDNPAVLQTGRFAGQEMIALADADGAFELYYLGFVARGLPTMDAAMEAAPDFARTVLERLASMLV